MATTPCRMARRITRDDTSTTTTTIVSTTAATGWSIVILAGTNTGWRQKTGSFISCIVVVSGFTVDEIEASVRAVLG